MTYRKVFSSSLKKNKNKNKNDDIVATLEVFLTFESKHECLAKRFADRLYAVPMRERKILMKECK